MLRRPFLAHRSDAASRNSRASEWTIRQERIIVRMDFKECRGVIAMFMSRGAEISRRLRNARVLRYIYREQNKILPIIFIYLVAGASERSPRRGLGGGAVGGNYMNDAISAALKRAQKFRDHGGSLRSGVVEQHNAATQGFKPLEYQLKLLTGRLRIPVAGP